MRHSLACPSPMIINSVFSGLSVTNDNKFSFLSHPVLDTCETLSKLSKTGIKVPMVQC